MSRFLIVTHQTARSPELQTKVAELIAIDPSAEFSLLVPEREDEIISWEGEAVDIAQQRAEAAQEQLKQNTGARIVRATSGPSDPLKAIEQELTEQHEYTAILICTLPRGRS